MTAIPRRSPKIAFGQAPNPIRDAINTLEDQPAIPESTPASSTADGFEGQITFDSSYLYICLGASWKRIALSSF